MISCHTAFMAAAIFLVLGIFTENTAQSHASRRMVLAPPLCLLGGVALYAVSLMSARSMTLSIALILAMSVITHNKDSAFKRPLSSVFQAILMTASALLFYKGIGAHTGLGLLSYGYCATTFAFLAIACDRNGFFLKQCYRESPLMAAGTFLLAPFVLVFIAVHYMREERTAPPSCRMSS